MNKLASCIKLNWPAHKGDTALNIFENGGIQLGSFEVKNPDLSPSPIYIDLRMPGNGGPLTGYTINRIAVELFFALTDPHDYDLVAGIPNAGTPIANRLYDMILYDAKDRCVSRASFEKQGEGEGRRIVKFFSPHGGKALIVDDVISGADTKLEAAYAVEKSGCTVSSFAVCVDREQGGVERLKELGYKVVSAYKISELLEFYMLLGVITNEKRHEIMHYIERTKKIIAAS